MSRIERLFLIRPLEPLYFGPPRSFSAGENHYSVSQFPPSPFAFQGLIRSHLLRSVSDPPLDLNDWSKPAVLEREKIVGRPSGLPSDWQIKGPLPANVSSDSRTSGLDASIAAPWVPAPGFLMGESGQPEFARPVRSTHEGMNDLDNAFVLLGRPELGLLSSIGGWIGPNNLLYALSGGKKGKWDPDEYADPYPPFIRSEFQPGVAIDSDAGSSVHGMLYALESLRFGHGTGLLGWFSGSIDERIPLDAFERGIVGAGRKGRIAFMEKVESLHPAWQQILEGTHLPHRVEESACFWLVALTPARMSNHLHPEIKTDLSPGIRVIFKGAVRRGSVTLGGYQMATGKSRSNRHYFPAGSVWLFQLKGGDPETRATALRLLNDSAALGSGGETSFGFGHTLVGIGPDEKEIGS